MKRLIERIASYQPANEQERQDQQLMLSYINLFTDVLTQQNAICHFVSAGFILNETCTKTLMVYQQDLGEYGWVSCHLNGNPNCLAMAHQAVMAQTGLPALKMISSKTISLDILPVTGHYKNEHYIQPHLHLSIGHLFMASEMNHLSVPGHDIRWFGHDELLLSVKEPILATLYQKIWEKVRFLQEAPF